jgi:hypothetical protein
MNFKCRICGLTTGSQDALANHITRCVERNADFVDHVRPNVMSFGDPELAAFAREEGSVYNRRPGTRRRPR